MSEITILHLSDLHFGIDEKEEDARAQRTIAMDGLNNKIAELCQQGWKPEIVVVSGDIAYRGTKKDYDIAIQWLNKLQNQLEINSDSFIFVPGNHDLDREKTDCFVRPHNAAEADKILSPKNIRRLEDYFDSYINFCKQLDIPAYRLGSSENILVGTRDVKGICFCVLNSAWYCRDNKDKSNLWIGLPQINIMKAEGQLPSIENFDSAKTTVAVFHHPQEWFNDYELNVYDIQRPATYELLANHCHLILSGHVHSQTIKEPYRIRNAYVITGGATYQQGYRNNCSVIKVNTRTKGLKRRTLQYEPAEQKWVINDAGPGIQLGATQGSSSDLHERCIQAFNSLISDINHEEQFQYTVRFAKSYSDLIRLKTDERLCVDAIIPHQTKRAVVLHGGGGAGKSNILKLLYGKMLQKGVLPFYIDLKNLAGENPGENSQAIIDNVLSSIVPAINKDEFESTIGRATTVLIVDSFNEVSAETRQIILQYCAELLKQQQLHIIIADRITDSWDYPGFSHAMVNTLTLEEIQPVFDKAFGENAFHKLSDHLRQIYQRPFFLSLALKTNKDFAGSRIKSEIFDAYFNTHLNFTAEEITRIAQVTFESLSSEGSANPHTLREKRDALFPKLIGAGILKPTYEFDHHLWRDYLVSRHLAQKSNWCDLDFDFATIYSSSLESLTLTLEQMNSSNQKDSFLKAVYDWNYSAAIYCIGELLDAQSEGITSLGKGICNAVRAAIAEKRFDEIQRTRTKAEQRLRSHLPSESPFLTCSGRNKLESYVKQLYDGEATWFEEWKKLFTDDGGYLRGNIILIENEDPLLGWTAANLARRASLTNDDQERVRAIYRDESSSNKNSIRWRCVHILGFYPNQENIDLLFDALCNDQYHWVKYGATRALVEIAYRAEPEMRRGVFDRLASSLQNVHFGTTGMRKEIIREAMECLFVDCYEADWVGSASGFLQVIVEMECDNLKEFMERRQEFLRLYDTR
ncbi:metallophosphoesterase [Sporomusa aerivorans]|uniref:metallophosphoesterase n=1 Tax=Sporomusa aerivorans TaxID=204936 RepID=UPI00352BAE31